MRRFAFAWEPVAAGRLALWHRPRLATIAQLPRSGCTRVVTLLSEREGARAIGAAVERAGLAWSWIPLASGRPPEGRPSREARAGIVELDRHLRGGASVLLHCSAGIHRTGLVAYALFRHRGLDPDQARAAVRRLRAVTAEGLRPEHLRWGDQKGVSTES
jgi:protein-tyrosine phosphatase